jgi:hypothetical protein
MTRTVTGPVATAIAQPNVGIVLLVELLFDSGAVRACSAGYNLDWNGHTWIGVGVMGAVEEVQEGEGGEVSGLAFTLSGVPSALVAIALGENYQRRVVNVYVAFLDLPSHAILADPVLEWSGLLDTMTVADDNSSATIRVTAENELFDFARPQPIYWTDEDQRKLYPSDTGFRFAKQLNDRQIVWPSREYFLR